MKPYTDEIRKIIVLVKADQKALMNDTVKRDPITLAQEIMKLQKVTEILSDCIDELNGKL